MSDVKITHQCLPYCNPGKGEHTELVYTDESATEGTIAQALGFYRGLKVMRAVPEADAPPPERVEHDVISRGSKALAKAWLVTWR